MDATLDELGSYTSHYGEEKDDWRSLPYWEEPLLERVHSVLRSSSQYGMSFSVDNLSRKEQHSSLDLCCGLLGSAYVIITFGSSFDYKHSHPFRMITCLFRGLREQKIFDFIVVMGGFNSSWGLLFLYQQKHQFYRQACTSWVRQCDLNDKY